MRRKSRRLLVSSFGAIAILLQKVGGRRVENRTGQERMATGLASDGGQRQGATGDRVA